MTTPSSTPPKAANPFREAVASTTDLVECFGISKMSISKLATSGVLEKTSHGTWPAFETVREYVDYLRSRKVNQHDTGGGDFAEVAEQYERDKARKMKADADIAQITADLMAGRVHEAVAVEELWSSMQAAARSKMLGLPSKLAAEAPADLSKMVLKIATEIVRGALEELGDYNAQNIAERTDRKRVSDPTPTADDAAVEAAAAVEPEPVG